MLGPGRKGGKINLIRLLAYLNEVTTWYRSFIQRPEQHYDRTRVLRVSAAAPGQGRSGNGV